MTVTADASSAANTRDVVIPVALPIAIYRMNRPAISVVNESREFTFTDIANEAFWISIKHVIGLRAGRRAE
jgi:hypothetical protein